jgi:uncharacterized protein
LRLNAGFLIPQSVGYSRDFNFNLREFHLVPEVCIYDLAGTAHATRTSHGILLQVVTRANLTSQCARCLKDFNHLLEVDFIEVYAFSERFVTDSELILPDDGYIDLEPLVREYLLLEVPISPFCTQDCQGLCPICGENMNDVDCKHDDEIVDSRLAVLKSLLEDK